MSIVKIFLYGAICTCFTLFPAAACQLTFAVSNEFPPHHIHENDGKWRGVAVDLFQWLASGAGCEVQVVNVPWDRTVGMLERGQVDAVSLFTLSAQRQQFSRFVGPHYQENIVVIVKSVFANQLVKEQDLALFKGLIGKTPGTDYGSSLQTILNMPSLQNNLVDVVANENRIKMFRAGRLDAILEEAAVAKYLFNSEQLNADEHLIKLRFKANPVYFGFSKKSVKQETIIAIKQSWQNMKNNGAIRSVYQQYGLTNNSTINTQ